MPKLLHEIQQLESDRIEKMQQNLKNAVSSQKSTLPVLVSAFDQIEKGVDLIDATRDIADYVSKHKSGKKTEFAHYEAFDSTKNYSTTGTEIGGEQLLGEQVKAQFDYKGTDENELTFSVGDTITILQKPEGGVGWYQGKTADGKIGMFPSNYVAPANSTQEKALTCRAIYEYKGQDSAELSFKTGDIFTIEYEEEGWYFVYNSSNQYGRIPSNYVERL